MSKIEVDAIDKQSGSTLTLGGSGTAVTLASGATQTGFGRTGTVDWQTGSIKTATFTAANGEGYFANTTAGGFTMNLPASPSAGDIVSVKDYAYTFGSNNLTIGRNGSNIGGAATDNPIVSTNGAALTFIFVDGTKGWLVINESTDTTQALNPTYITATGGTITTSGNFKIHTFTGPGTFTVCSVGNASGSNTVSYLVVAGGGSNGNSYGAGGGAGGYREGKASSDCYTASPLNASSGPTFNLPVSAQGYPITVGGGGAARSGGGVGNVGNNSIFSTITSAGGGYGGNESNPGGNGGSGGGSGNSNPNSPTGGTGNTPPVSPAQGTNGETSPLTNAAGGGGGASEAGGTNGAGGYGGDGAQTAITGAAVFYAGGGGGYSNVISDVRPGGDGGGGGGPGPAGGPWDGVANTGGGSSYSNPSPNNHSGGSGIVVIRYKFQT